MDTQHEPRGTCSNWNGTSARTAPTSILCRGMWHAFLFKVLIRVAEFTAMVDPWKGRIVTDSQSVLKTLGGGDVDPQEAEEPVRIDGNTVVLDVLCPD